MTRQKKSRALIMAPMVSMTPTTITTITLTLPPEARALPVGTFVDIVVSDGVSWPAEVRARELAENGCQQLLMVLRAKGAQHDHARAPTA